ncbi:hypothetical protein HZU75_13325 [Chitinibacter fontanus]|uniref:Uncharacterized protein n=1 Tax=Chitinibacter fontanus TaxID=1737446 RepID=A0A7D5ZII8_9NEIS|nr:hypothetical protein [Chitinibacter fontanus]QLI82427.1 hypothetical protein HZU75_13325 [Chitinibacter fontanus]
MPCASIEACVQLVAKNYVPKANVPKRLRACEVTTSPALAVAERQEYWIVFSTIAACGGGSNLATEMLLLKSQQNHFDLLSHIAVGGKWLQIDDSIVMFVEPDWFYVRLVAWPQWADAATAKQENHYFMRYALINGQLQQLDQNIYQQDGGQFKLVTEYLAP